MLTDAADALDRSIQWFCRQMPDESFAAFEWNVRALLAILLVALVCGAIGSLVVGNRMAFFSDALAHSTFAGIALGLLLAIFTPLGIQGFREWNLPIMIGFGIMVGVGIAWVQENTALANDTVIGVFFAGAIGLGAVFMKAVSGRGFFTLESFLFGDPLTVRAVDLIYLFVLVIAVALFLMFIYNSLVFTTFNSSLARSRRVRIRLCNYLFIVFLGVIVNLCLHVVGALLINALLIVPAATAANLSRNMRQMFWWSISLCLAAGFLGQWLSWEVRITDPTGPNPIQFGVSGAIVVLSVFLFFVSMVCGRRWRDRSRAEPLAET